MVTKRELFKTAHAIARQGVARFGGSYAVAFAAALRIAYQESKTMSKTITVAGLTAAGLSVGEWTHPKTGEIRFYVNNQAELLGLEISRYGTGNISSARLNGEKTSNAEAGRILNAIGKCWIDASGAVHAQPAQFCPRGYTHIAAKVARAVEARIAA